MLQLNLVSIQEFVQQVAEAIATALRIEVMVLDPESNIISGTGVTKMEVGKRYENGSLTNSLAVNGLPIITRNPGSSLECKKCFRFGTCPYFSVIAYPIYVGKNMLGSFCIVATNEEQRQRVLAEEDDMLKFLNKMCLLIASNINERQIQEELNLSIKRYDNVVNSVAEAIIVTNQAGNIIHLNRSAVNWLSVELKDVVGHHLTSLFPDLTISDDVLEKRKKIETELSYQPKSKTKKEYFLATIMPVLTQDEKEVRGATISLRNLNDVHSYAAKFVGEYNKYTFEDIQGKSEGIDLVKSKLQKAARTDSTILIRGESGTGKELFAHAIHGASFRRNAPFVAINCSAIPETLMESELFGYEEGAFTGAKKGGKPGKFELAAGGTLFLDEIGDMPLHLQSKLLRVLENHSIVRVGGIDSIAIDVRIIAATNRNLEEMVETREFRGDLYYRLSVIPVFIPPLRERKEDILILIEYFLDKHRKILNRDRQLLDSSTLEFLLNYHWPGNARELQNAIEYAVNMSESGQQILPEHLPQRFQMTISQDPLVNKQIIGVPNNTLGKGEPWLKAAEEELIREAIKRYGKTTSGKEEAARYLGISRATLYRRLKELNIIS